MDLTFIVTVDPVKSLSHLGPLIHAFNLQTRKTFNVHFYNQTRRTEEETLGLLPVRPAFPYEWHDMDPSRFLGNYPLWDLYAFHDFLLRTDRLSPYFMSLHMEEFPDPEYVEKASRFLERHRFDIVFGNLRRTPFSLGDVEPLLGTRTPAELRRYLEESGLRSSPPWATTRGRFVTLARELRARATGYYTTREYRDEDVFFMSVAFAKRFNWFLRGHPMYLEDIHICEQPGACELAREIRRFTPFPVYFRGSRLYHLRHEKYYFQLLDPEFTRRVLEMETDDPILRSLKMGIRALREKRVSLAEALRLTRQNPERMGTQNMNYRYHMLYLSPTAGGPSHG